MVVGTAAIQFDDCPTVANGETAFAIDGTNPYFAEASKLREEFSKDASARDRLGGRPCSQVGMLKKSGLLKLQIPGKHGGAGQPWSSVLRIVREFAKTDGSIAHLFGYHFVWANAAFIRGNPDQAARLYEGTVRNNWFWGNAANSFSRNLTGRRSGEQYILNGSHPFASGAHVADYLQIGWDDETSEQRWFAAIPANRPGITALDDWDGIGQRQTGSGTVTFENVLVHPNEVLDPSYNDQRPIATIGPALAQSVLLNIFIGCAQGALADARQYTMTKSRPWITSGVDHPSEDPWIKRTFGEFYIKIEAATLLADRAMESLDAAWREGRSLTHEQRGRNAIEIAAANVVATEVALDVTNRMFEVMGARSATNAHGYDRYWRNVRTHSLHSPVEYRVQNVGAWFLTGQFPPPNVFQ
jgi:alkylation response protein AidB-like acyl-CoA dehydrogenase